MRSCLSLSALSICLMSTSPALAGICEEALSRAKSPTADVVELDALFGEVDRSCPAPVARQVGDLLGRKHFDAFRGANNGAERERHLRAAVLHLDRERWQAHAALGDVLQARKDYQRAAEQFQLALLQIEERDDVTAPPDAIKWLLGRANASRALAPTYTRALRTRSDNRPGGVAADSIDGVDIDEVPFPVEFDFNSDELTDDGMLAVQDMLDILRQSGASQVVLVGHTDPIGSADYNKELSLRRARTVGEALLRLGLDIDVRIAGAGESQPPEFDNPDLYSEDERHRIMRRVVIAR